MGFKTKNGKKISNELVIQVPFQISTFGQDISGEVYFTDFGSGNIFRIAKKIERFAKNDSIAC
ncbi:hypothetical protein LEP1GSC158_1546 [Leptospira interrogans serovar Zanoni str. LT2156]|uniref:Uncharacterized protein n=1 Tax=Leptospira interrogans serovar Zanoni str. LT2156 TaxID=1001601 RepID=M6HNC1_LEPIR|nr:hypothetical protein LEP1GSC158_1546 [Leptospira interrogans serovar Zanoni str. LT2156]